MGFLLMKYLSIQNQIEPPPNHCKNKKLLLVSFILDVIWRASQWQYLTTAVSSVIVNLRKVASYFICLQVPFHPAPVLNVGTNLSVSVAGCCKLPATVQ
jgi:hypothetical protein